MVSRYGVAAGLCLPLLDESEAGYAGLARTSAAHFFRLFRHGSLESFWLSLPRQLSPAKPRATPLIDTQDRTSISRPRP